MVHHIAKANKVFTIGEGLILPASIDIFHELLGEVAVKGIVQVSLLARTVLRQIEDIAEDIKTLLLEQIVKSPWFAIQCDLSTGIGNQAALLVYAQYLFLEIIHKDMLCILLLPTHTTANELFKALNSYFTGKLNWFFCVSVCMDGPAAMIG